jgi:DNA-binding response OmpR family regulator
LARKVWRIRRGYIGPQVRSHVANLRRKLDRGDLGSVIKTDVGVGYRFVGHDGDAGTGTDDRGSRL